MKTQLSVILILTVCILTGCGKSMKDVAGVYETAEIKESIKGNGSMYYSTIWVLDLAESGTFTLKEHKSRKHMQSQKYAPVPVSGVEESGKWSLDGVRITISFRPLYELDESDRTEDEPYLVQIPFESQSTGDVVAGANDVSGGRSVKGEFSPDLYILNLAYDIEGLRFKRVK